jgi:hypothetical protein
MEDKERERSTVNGWGAWSAVTGWPRAGWGCGFVRAWVWRACVRCFDLGVMRAGWPTRWVPVWLGGSVSVKKNYRCQDTSATAG